MKPTIETTDSFSIVGFDFTRFDNNVMDTWNALKSYKLELIPNIKSSISFGVSRTSAKGNFSYFAGYVLVDSPNYVPDNFNVLQIIKQKYAKFTHKGNASSIIETKKEIWSTWLPEYRLTPMNILVGSHYPAIIERFDERFLGLENEDSEMEIWISIN